MRKKEEEIHLRVCDYLRKNYPDVLFRTDFSSGMKMTPGQARNWLLKNGAKQVEIFINK